MVLKTSAGLFRLEETTPEVPAGRSANSSQRARVRALRMILTVAALLCLAALSCPASQVSRVHDTEISRSVKLPYLLYLPAKYNENPNRRWPLLLYLHGGSARGNDLDKLRTLGLPKRLDSDPEFPFIVISPLCPEGEIWTDTDAVASLIDSVQRLHRIDVDRVYVTGHSMGGRGALYMAYKHPKRFAAVVAMSPVSPITAWAGRLRNIPLWLIHGAKDEQAPVKESEELISAIEKGGGKPRFTRLEDRDHFILDQYEGSAIIDWLLELAKSPAAATPAPTP
jgi:predicted peptidase